MTESADGVHAHVLRRRLREERSSFERDHLARAARALAHHLEGLPELAGPGRLATYFPADGELDPNVVLESLRARGWQVHLPVVEAARRMRFVPWQPDAVLVPNRYGIPEPRSSHTPVGAEDLDVVLVPSVGLDHLGNRLGFGVGYYDRALSVPPAERPVLIGIAHDSAVVPELSPAPWDIPVDVVVTDRRVLRPSGRGRRSSD